MNPAGGNNFLAEVLRPVSFFYGVGAYARLVSYSIGLKSRRSAAVPVVSVGNITVGGTGKTPLTIDLATRLSQQYKVAILSRGYGRQSKGLLVVSDGNQTLVTVEAAGDEPYLMALAVPQAIVIVCSSRIEAAQVAVEKYGAEIIVLDDGFQHIKICRDLDIVLWDYNDPPARSMLVPSGRLREPLTGLSRASEIVITKVPQNLPEGELEALADQLSELSGGVNVSSCRFVPEALRSYSGKSSSKMNSEAMSLSALAGKKVYSLCAIARPEGFTSLITDLGALVVGSKAFADHHWFSPAQIKEIESEFIASGAEYLITTEKDLVRMILPEALQTKTLAVVLKCQWISSIPQAFENLMPNKQKGYV